MEKTYLFVSENIIRLRNKLGLTQSELAEKAKMSLRGIQNIEYGKTHGSRSLPDIAKALGVSSEELLRNPNEKPGKKPKNNPISLKGKVLDTEFLHLSALVLDELASCSPKRRAFVLAILFHDESFLDIVPQSHNLRALLKSV